MGQPEPGLRTQAEADAGVVLSHAEMAARVTAREALLSLGPAGRARALRWLRGVFGITQGGDGQ